ncbi:polysulfide reductase [Shewanella sp. Choline-02u-19]|jgi:polysulfide reductase chain C|uniref:NrfD/PsrC family molybdoenzyme membrane anchor subunit n=1 Tax=unclassified Shewanella TaxID=196818 RepID=UPI000C333113|nr:MULTISPECIES: NrfD/PsrC family molybdoenzyme membrane anchor subunit [unclassified Shewanella]PKG55019.1 polysulfide reductase [Shewanella sp. GutDb-MelDb]PKG75085.1 polysulfide reductase [Shewanella sp. GutCb]PKH58522.1 polysulfide reductase [Shewanella sp. Bg11-22]PKI26596.1 polysulfide reductase [Shewanella sp. Choline-02u-19]
MNNIWGSMEQYDPVVWNWIIAVYLFMAGLSAGSMLVAIGLKWYKKSRGLPTEGLPVIKAAAIVAPVSISLGMALLVLDLTKPFEFYHILLNYNLTSVMAWGVLALLVYIPLVFVFAALVFEKQVLKYAPWLAGILKVCRQLENSIHKLIFVLAIGVGAYTGFLLSALISYPILNTAILPALFLTSALSAGSAGNVLVATLFFSKEKSDCIDQVHRIEYPVAFNEALCLVLLFVGLNFSGPAAQGALGAITQGVWASVFWIGVVGLGLLVPVLSSIFAPKSWRHTKGFLITVSCSTILGVLALRHFVVYAGQSYIS